MATKPAAPLPPSTAPVPPAAAPAYTFDDGLDIPGRTVSAIGQPSPLHLKLKAMNVGQSFIEAVTVDASVTDPTERAKAFAEKCRTVSNRLSGAIRRFRKGGGEGMNFTIRTVSSDTHGYGVRVWRTPDDTAA